MWKFQNLILFLLKCPKTVVVVNFYSHRQIIQMLIHHLTIQPKPLSS